eukprot:3779095-Pyramimonas_sp.AAC.1
MDLVKVCIKFPKAFIHRGLKRHQAQQAARLMGWNGTPFLDPVKVALQVPWAKGQLADIVSIRAPGGLGTQSKRFEERYSLSSAC